MLLYGVDSSDSKVPKPATRPTPGNNIDILHLGLAGLSKCGRRVDRPDQINQPSHVFNSGVPRIFSLSSSSGGLARRSAGTDLERPVALGMMPGAPHAPTTERQLPRNTEECRTQKNCSKSLQNAHSLENELIL